MTTRRPTRLRLDSLEATERHARQVAARIRPPCLIFLNGVLGAGKTTWVRGLMRALGYSGMVKSPSYTLVEPYELPLGQVYHFDLYRIDSKEELYAIGWEDYLHEGSICLVEWADRLAEDLPPPDLDLRLKYPLKCPGKMQENVRELEIKQNDSLIFSKKNENLPMQKP